MVPQVQVLMPVRDGEKTVERATRSILEQTLTALEIVVVDDGSSDRTVEIVKSIAAEDRRVVILEQPRLGLVPALNYGFEQCSAPLVARMDADDWSWPTRLAHQVALIEKGADLVGTRVRVLDGAAGYEHYVDWQNQLVEHAQIVRDIFVESPIAHPSMLARHALLKDLKGYSHAPWPEDYDLWFRAWLGGARFAKTDEILLDWFDRADRASRIDSRYGERAFFNCKAHFLCRSALADEQRCVIWGTGKTGRGLGRALQERGVRIEHFVDIHSPGSRECRGIPVLAPEQLKPEPGRVLIAAVALRGAREMIRDCAKRVGFIEGDDFFCAA